MKPMTISKVKKLLNQPGLLVVAQIPINGDDVINVSMTKNAAYLAIKDLDGKTITGWSYVEEHNLLVMG